MFEDHAEVLQLWRRRQVRLIHLVDLEAVCVFESTFMRITEFTDSNQHLCGAA